MIKNVMMVIISMVLVSSYAMAEDTDRMLDGIFKKHGNDYVMTRLVRSWQKMLPIEQGPGLAITKATYSAHDDTLHYIYTVEDEEAQLVLLLDPDVMAKSIDKHKVAMCNSSPDKVYLNNGVTISVDYSNESGHPIYSFSASKEWCSNDL